jgi:hypothetical protein
VSSRGFLSRGSPAWEGVRREDFAARGKKASAKGWFGVEGVAAREVFFLRQQIETVAAI